MLFVVPRGIEPLFLGWKPSVLTDRRRDLLSYYCGAKINVYFLLPNNFRKYFIIFLIKSKFVVPRGIEPLFLGWKPSVLTDRRRDHLIWINYSYFLKNVFFDFALGFVEKSMYNSNNLNQVELYSDIFIPD